VRIHCPEVGLEDIHELSEVEVGGRCDYVLENGVQVFGGVLDVAVHVSIQLEQGIEDAEEEILIGYEFPGHCLGYIVQSLAGIVSDTSVLIVEGEGDWLNDLV